MSDTTDGGEAIATFVAFPQDANHLGSLFGGTLMSWMDRVAFLAAVRRAAGTVVTRAVDHLEFRVPIHVGDIVECHGHVEAVGETSLFVTVDVWRETPGSDQGRELCTTGKFVMVAVDDDGHPRSVPKDT